MKKIFRRLILPSVIFFLTSPIILSQTFTEVGTLTGVSNSSVSWGDYDNNGDLDIMLTGANYSVIYQNDEGAFTDIGAGLTGVNYCSSSWGDYDNDGDLDILLAGNSSSGAVSIIYRNDNGSFTDIAAGLPGVTYASAAWGDYDSDGDLDILLAGISTEGAISRVYRNDNGVFTDINAKLTGVEIGSVTWGDYDNDGDLDVLLIGRTSQPYSVIISKIYRNDNGIFNDISTGLIGVYNGSVAFGDYDNDGDLDILINGKTSAYLNITKIYRNNNGSFNDINANLPGTSGGCVRWGDYDNDGDLDILLMGNGDGNITSSSILQNNSGTFTDINAGLTGVGEGSSAAWGDYDKDGDLDILLTGSSTTGYISKIYKNNTLTLNTVPTAPSNLHTTVTGTGIILAWDKTTDIQTPQNGLSYNIYIGTSSGAVNKRSPMAILPEGYRKIVQKDQIQNNFWKIKRLPAATYYWSVQAIDNSFAGSAFATQGTFTVPFSSSISPVADQTLIINQSSSLLTVSESSTPASRQWKYSVIKGGPYDQVIAGVTGMTCSPSFAEQGVYYVICESTKGGIAYTSNEIKIIVSDFIEQTGISLIGVKYSSAAWGDYDNNGDLDLLITGYNESEGNISTIYRNISGSFTDIGAGLNGIEKGCGTWGDYDNDGDLDILLSGSGYTEVYKNSSGTFAGIGAGLAGLSNGSSAWGDYDNDGDLDILLVGMNGSFIYRNDGGAFININAGLRSASSGSAKWGDYDNDGDLDILLTGSGDSKIYRNDNGIFSDINAGLISGYYGSGEWGDYDNDGDLDLLLSGDNFTKIYNNNNGIFIQANTSLPKLNYSSAAWGDCDNDGDLDILLSGYSPEGRISDIYINDNGSFTKIPTNLPGVQYSSVAWGDYDNDKDLDFVLTGSTSSGEIAKIFKNHTFTHNTLPLAPANLQVIQGANKVTLTWDRSTDTETPQDGLTYNLYIGTSAGSVNRKSPMAALPGGYRRIVSNGSQGSSWDMKNLPAGTYFWSVQAIDKSFTGSAFSTESSFAVIYSNSISPVNDQSLLINQNGNILSVSEPSTADSRQWKYSTVRGGPYDHTISGATGTMYTPNFPEWGIYYVVCVSTKNGTEYISNEVKINIPVFTLLTGSFLPGWDNGFAEWGDYDNDDDLDILLPDHSSSLIMRNDAGIFTYTNPGLPGNSSGCSADWGDYDNDGDIDVLMTTSSGTTAIYRNDDGAFSNHYSGLPGVWWNSSLMWGDYDNDGDLDVLLSGNFTTKIFRNDSGTFTDINANLISFLWASVAWGDYDNDGDLDILITGFSNSNNNISVIYRNDAGVFTDINAGIESGVSGSLDWGDYDNDGDLDILITGSSGTWESISRVYRNDNGIFPDINAGLTGVANSSGSWGDYDNDGDLDILLAGRATSGSVTKIYRNDNGTFIEINSDITGVEYCSVAWGDYDNDGDLDILLSGTSSSGNISNVFKNNINTPNTPPSAPSNLQTSLASKGIAFSWTKSTDSKTPQSGLSYNLYIGTASGFVDKKSPVAELSTGYRKVVQRGSQTNTWSIRNLPVGTYYWSVQAIDKSFAGSAFAGETSFTVSFTNSVSPAAEQTVQINQDGTTITITESAVSTSRQWKYSTVSGGPYNQTIAGATGLSYTPNFSDFGTYYVVCQSVYNLVTYTTNEIKINVPLFSELTGFSLPGIQYGTVAWGDFDDDHDLDILMTGSDKTKIFRNNSGIFSDINAGLSGVGYSSAAWGDYDNDGDIDILLSGYTSSGTLITSVYRNDAGVFTDINAGLQGIRYGSVLWGDYDNDGDLDILITGGYITRIYRNDNGIFKDINAGLPGMTYSSSAWGDYDIDGDLDVLLTGFSGGGCFSMIYNNNNGTFTDINAGLTGVYRSSVAWGDFDSDGDPDILLSGYTGTGYVSKIYRNENGIFTDINAGLQGISYGSVAWGDYDNDGDLDVLLTGNGYSKIYQNNSGTFSEINSSLPGITYSSAAWGDFDYDGDLDIVLSGLGLSYSNISKVFNNNMLVSNTAPSEPANLQTVLEANKVTFSWDKSTDIETGQNGLSYNFYIGATAGSVSKKSPMAYLPGGYRQIVQGGIQSNSWAIKDLPSGTYYWSVQTIDNSFTGSLFAAEDSFTIDYSNSVSPATDQTLLINHDGTTLAVTESSPAESRQWKYSQVTGGPYNNIIAGASSASFTPNFPAWGTYYVVCVSTKSAIEYTSNEVKISLPPFIEQTGINLMDIGSYSSVCWGDYDNDDDLDILMTGNSSLGYVSKIYNNDNGIFTEIDARLTIAYAGFAAWIDFDNDSDLDILLTGGENSLNLASRIYRNDNGIFTEINAGLPGIYKASADLGDYDNDGDLDIVICGQATATTSISRIYYNDNNVFIDINANLEGVRNGSVAWGDYDNDGDLDIVLTGLNNGSLPVAFIYRNDDGVFTDLNAGLTGVSNGSVAWGDYDNDGDLDILMSGYNNPDYYSKIYRNNNGIFTDINANLTGVQASSAAWGDYDNDGDLDILLCGSNISGYISRLYQNNGGVFSPVETNLEKLYNGSVAWGDYDNDGDLDILLTGYNGFAYESIIYKNTSPVANTSPDTPANLGLLAPDLSKVILSWDKATDLQTPQNSLTYNLRVGTSAGGNNIKSPMSSESTGYRRIPSRGNAEFKNTGYTLNNLSPGTYYWSVQAIDQAYAGGSWATESSFTLLEAPAATTATSITQTSLTANWSTSEAATGYRIDVSTNAAFTTMVSGYDNKDVGNITSSSVSGLTSNTTYYYRVKAYISTGTSIIYSNSISATTLVDIPPAPDALDATSISQSAFTANWTASGSAAGYRLDVATDNSFTAFVGVYNNLDVGNTTSRAITGLVEYTQYFYRIRAYNVGGTSGNSDTIQIKTLPNIPPAPVAVDATAINQTGFTANWNSASTAAGYRLDIATDIAFTSFIVDYNNKDVTNVTNYVVTGLTANSTYYYRIRAYNVVGTSASSGTITVLTIANPPAIPVAIAADNVTTNGFRANWSSSTGATGYRIDISSDNSFTSMLTDYNDKDVGNVINATITGLASNTTYYYRVRAYNSGGTSGNSNIITAVLTPDLPETPVATSATSVLQTSFVANWNSSAKATGYRLDVATSSTFTTMVTGYDNLNVGNVTLYPITGLSANMTYYYRVRVYNAVGTSGSSNTITVTTLPNPPAAPSGLTASSCNNLVTLSWTANTETDFQKYIIYGGTTANPTTRIDSTASISAVTKTLSGLTGGQTYYFRITAVISPGVASQFSTSVSVLIKKGVVPKIKSKFQGAVLVCYNIGDSIASWQWYKGTTSISGATKQYYVTGGVKDSFSVLTTDKNGCQNSSNIITLTGTKSISVYPNPAEDNFKLKFSSEFIGRTMISLYNASGIKVSEYQTDKPDEELECIVPVSNLPDGLYTVEIVIDGEVVEYSRIMVIN